jgi:hypothetical protein
MNAAGNNLNAQRACLGHSFELFTGYSGAAKCVEGPSADDHKLPLPVRSSKQSHDEAQQRQLWTVSEELTGVTYPV